MKTERILPYRQRAEFLLNGFLNHVDVFWELDGSVGEAAVDARNRFLVIIDLEFGELESMRRGR